MIKYFVVLLGVVMFYLFSPYFQKLDPTSYSANLPIMLDGPVSINDRLDSAEKLFEGQIHWPESMAVFEGNLYTGLGDGRIVRITERGVEDVCRIGDDCEGQYQENICGRPLGMRFSKSGTLYVVDAYLGLFSVDVRTGSKTHLLKSSRRVDGKPLTFFNNVAIDEEEQVLYLTQSSAKWNISMVLISIFEHENTGRLLKYDMKKDTVTVLKKGFSFPNGLELSHDGKSLLMAEGNEHLIYRYYIKGPEKGELKKLPLVLPGELDNISRNKRGNYWVAVANVRTASTPTTYDKLSHYPILRKGVLIFHHFLAFPISCVLRLIPSPKAKDFAFELLSGRLAADIITQHTMIVEFNDEGKVIQTLQSPSGKVCCLSEIQEHNGYLYLGSWRNRYLLRVKQ